MALIQDTDAILVAYKNAARAAAKAPGIPVSITYAVAREIWALWWKRFEQLRQEVSEK